MFKRIIAGLLSIVLTLTVFPEGAFAGEKANYVQELSQKNYILNLVGDDSVTYRSGAALSENMNAAQVEQCLDELLNTELEGTLNDLENIALYGQQKNNESKSSNKNAVNYDEAINLLNDLRKVRSEVKGCLDIISSNRAYIKNAMKAFEQGNVYSNEHETEAAANQVIVRTDELETQIANAASLYAGWKESISGAKERIIAATNPNAKLNASTDALQRQIVRLKTGRAAEVERLAAAEKASSQSQDIVIDVVSINEIRIYALNKDGEPLRNATVYCWRADDSVNGTPSKGPARRPNAEGYVTIPTAELGADENHYMTAGYEIVCPGYRTQYAQANYIKGAEIFWCYLEENDPREDVYVAGISLNGFDCKWYEKDLYITDANTADQTVTLFLRSQSGDDFSGVAEMKFENRTPSANGAGQTRMEADYTSTNGQAQATFKSKLCQQIAGGQEHAMSFSLSTSVSNAEITPSLRSKDALIEKTQYVQNNDLIDALYFGQLSFAWPGDVPFLNGMSMNFDVGKILNGHIYLLTNCSGLWAVFASTTQQPVFDKIQKLNDEWMTADSKKIEAFSTEEIVEKTGMTKQQIASEYKTSKYECGIPGTYGGKKIYGNASLVVAGTYDEFKKIDFSAVIGLQVGFRGDWTKQMFLGGVFPVNVGWGFDLSASVFFKFGFSGWEYDGTDISATFRLIGYMSGGPGIRMRFCGKTFTAGLGFRFQLGLSLTVPIFSSMSGPEDDAIFTFNIGLSFYADFFFAHFVWNMWSGTGELNLDTGDFKFTSQPFWRAKDSAALLSASGIALGDAANANETTIDEEIFSQDQINGDTRWNYTQYDFTTAADAVPTYFTLHWDGSGVYKSDCDYIFWVENQSSVKFTSTNFSTGFAQTFSFPSEIQEKLDSGEWKVTGVRAAAHPQVYNVSVRMGGNYAIEKVQLATVSVTIGTDYKPQTETQDGKTITKDMPTGTVVVTRMYLYDGNMSVLRYPSSDTQLSEVIFVDKIDSPLSDALGMIMSTSLKGWSPAGRTQLIEDIVLDMDSEVTVVSFATQDIPDATQTVYFVSKTPGPTIEDKSVRTVGLPDGKPVKQLVGGAGYNGFLITLMEDGTVWHLSSYRSYVTQIEELSNIGDIAMVRTDFEENEYAYYTLFCTPKTGSTENAPLQSIILECEDIDCYTGVFTDYDVDLKGAPIFAGRLLNESYLYWFETFEDEQTGENRTAVRGMCYSPKYNMMTSSFRMGVLTGDDGIAPSGYTTTSAPISSHVMSDGSMLITKAWIPEEGEGETEAKEMMTTYKVAAERRVCGELMGAGTEKPAVSAGRDCDMLFTILNKGNVPLLGFDFNIYHENEDGVRELVQSSHVDMTNQTNNRVTYLKSGYSQAQPIVFTGEYSARRVEGLFDMINGDEWNITRSGSSANGSTQFVSVPALMPEGIQTYTMVFSVPIDWANKTEITCEIDKTYVPQYVADVFALSQSFSVSASDRSEMPVLAISMPKGEGMPLMAGQGTSAVVEVVGSLNKFGEKAIAQSGPLTDEHGSSMKYTYTPSDYSVEFNIVNLSLKCRVFEKDGEDYATITVFQDGQTDHTALRGVTLQAHIDDEKYPCFVYTFNTHHEDGRLAYSITLPIDTLLNGRSADRLTLSVYDTVSENEELSEADDRCVLELNRAFKIARQPENVSVLEGEDATFGVEIKNGNAPYTYTWQKLIAGKWKDIQTGESATLTLSNVTKIMNGMMLRCVISDSADERLVSDVVTLCVKSTQPVDPTEPTNPTEPTEPTDPTQPTQPTDPTKPTTPDTPDVPGTGDTSQMQLWSTLLIVSLGALTWTVICLKKRKSEE